MKRRTSHAQVTSSDRKRLVLLALFIFSLFCLLIVQFFKIQILEGEKWVREAQAQHQHFIIEPFMRGTFYSNTSLKKGHPESPQPLVFDVPKFHLYIDPSVIPLEHKKVIAEKIFTFVPCSQMEKEKIFDHFSRKSRSRKILKWLEREKREEILVWWKDYAKKNRIARNAIYFLQDFQRSHPFGASLGQVLHTVQEERVVDTQQALPTGGLEMYFNNYLKGKKGKRLIIRSPRHHLDLGQLVEAPENGADIYLTINHYLQAICEEELAKGVQNANAKGGWVVMMDPYSGEILALAQYPFFDVTNYRKFFNDPNLQLHTRCKAVTDCFEPGSIFKPITMAIALKANRVLRAMGQQEIFSPREMIPCSDGRFPGRSRPLKDGRLHKYLNMYQATQKSANVYMGKLAQRLIDCMGDQWYRQAHAELFGFGLKTKIELPAETPGLLPTPGKIHPNGKLEWSLPTPYSLAIGHNILVNSIQMIKAFAIIANGGWDVQPTLVRKIVKRESNKEVILLDNTQRKRDKPPMRILEPEISRELVYGLKFVTKFGGTAQFADIMGYTEAGKSGTSEKIINGKYSKKHFISTFVGFAPAQKPRFVLFIAIDEPEVKFIPGVGKNYHGGVCASPLFREIGRRSLQYLGVAPDDPYGYPYGDPRRDHKKADWAQEVIKLKQLYVEWNENS